MRGTGVEAAGRVTSMVAVVPAGFQPAEALREPYHTRGRTEHPAGLPDRIEDTAWQPREGVWVLFDLNLLLEWTRVHPSPQALPIVG